ncbi:ATP-dependent DNA helicase [Trichonephila clavipes]|nr:ATP-dependent DNA helicase [Trichonephila clavipes]
MMHGPCGSLNNNSPWMSDGKCTKRYPRDLLSETITGNDGYPLYRRRSTEDGGKSIKLKVLNNIIDVDNRWVVPYSSLLLKTYNAHINVEYCNSVKAIKYICKYVNKGSDMAMFGVENTTTSHDEVTQYQLERYISSNEAVWRILSFSIHERYPTVVHLAVHLENLQHVYFTSENVRARAMSPPLTTLTEFFTLCRNDTFTKTLLYSEVPAYFTWNTSTRKFQRRKQSNSFGRWSNSTFSIEIAIKFAAGDFRQTLPVILRSTPADELNACLKLSVLWLYVEKISLKTNVRVQLQQDESSERFAKQLLDIGNGMPPHILSLKFGSPIILLRNINPPRLGNGTRLSVKKLMNNIIEATILNGKHQGGHVLLPRIPMISTDTPFKFKRLQIPVRLAFAITINKAQGQSFQVCGLNLINPCFSYGQLYVGCSRVGEPSNLFILAPDRKAKSIVCLQTLLR